MDEVWRFYVVKTGIAKPRRGTKRAAPGSPKKAVGAHKAPALCCASSEAVRTKDD